MLTDLRFAFRTLARTPVLTLVAILSLALGIGANTSIFSMMDQVLLRPLPVPRPAELVNVTANGPRGGSNSNNTAGGAESVFSLPMVRDLEAKQTVMTHLGAHRSRGANIAYRKQTFSGQLVEVSGGYFPALGLTAALGRLLGPEDDKTRGGHPVAVVSHESWMQQFGADRNIAGQSILVNGSSFTVVGVAPEGFMGTTLGVRPDVFVPISMHQSVVPGSTWDTARRAYWVYLFGRLKPGVTRAQAESAMNVLYRGIINEVDAPLQTGASENYMKRFRGQQMTLTPGDRGQSQVHRNASTPMMLLLGITGFVLLIACANIANLLLARAAGRAREISIRLTIGASRLQLIRQLMTEAMVIAIAGGVAGLAFAYATTRLLLSFMPSTANLTLTADLNPRALLFALSVAIVTGVLFGLFPALHSSRADLVTALKDQAGNISASGGASRIRKVLVAGQVALSLMLLISAGLFIKSLVLVSRVDLGLRTTNIAAFGLSPELSQYKPAQTRALFEQLEERLAALPGVTKVTMAMVPLIADTNWGNDVSVDGFERGPDTDANSRMNVIGTEYFKTFGIRMIAGRVFTAADGASAPNVAIVNEAFARKFSPKESILGKRMSTSGAKRDIEIVGVAQDTKYSNVKQVTPPVYFLPYRQEKTLGSGTFYVATAAAPESAMAAIRGVVASLDPNLPVEQMTTMQRQVTEDLFLDRMISSFAAAFAGLATLLAAVGLYGVLAFNVTRRTREIGIRLALGAETGQVRNMVLGEVALMVAIGVAIALPAAFFVARFFESLLYEMKGRDPLVMVLATVAVAVVSLMAGYWPARRAMRIDPMSALRYE